KSWWVRGRAPLAGVAVLAICAGAQFTIAEVTPSKTSHTELIARFDEVFEPGPVFPEVAPSTCPDWTERCGDQCVNTQSNPTHCGGCDRSCVPGQVCVATLCTWSTVQPPPDPESPDMKLSLF